MPTASSAIQLSDSDTDAPKIAKILNKQLSPQSAPLRKPRIRKRRRVRKNNDHGCVTDDSVNDVPETARGWIVRKKIKKNKKRNTVYGEVSSTTNVDIEDKSVNNKTIYDLEREGPEIKASILVPTPITSEQIIETFSLDHPKITNIKMSAGKATRSKQDYKDVESDVIEDLRNAKETSAPKSDKINSTLKGSNNLEATGKLFVNEYLTEIKLNLSGIISESESKSIESDGTSKCKVNTNHELIWQAPGTSISPTLFPYLNPEEPSLSDDVFWSKFDNDYFRLDKPDMGTEKIYSSGIPEMTLDDAGIFSQLLDPSEFPELSKHVNMSEICENREWRKSSNRELFGSEEKNGFSTNNPPTFDSSFYY